MDQSLLRLLRRMTRHMRCGPWRNRRMANEVEVLAMQVLIPQSESSVDVPRGTSPHFSLEQPAFGLLVRMPTRPKPLRLKRR